ncbi:MAG: hypothetical protein DRR19_21820 [Candidatus Parabeggiatoa sp. nov. 1]|nr:MAG: hypothetical protein DRR19_21820 [Gammaproteobacteria bacterium]
MLKEYCLTQDDKNRKRWFQDDYFDLFTWEDETGQMTSFQLCYDRLGNERVISWDCNRGFGHHRVDDGEASPHKNMTPVFIRNGFFSYHEVNPKFAQSSKQISQDISRFIMQKLDEYVQQNPHSY